MKNRVNNWEEAQILDKDSNERPSGEKEQEADLI